MTISPMTVKRGVDIRRRRVCAAAGALPLLSWLPKLPEASAANAVRIRLGTLAPRGSSYHRALQEMGERWRRVQGPDSEFTVFTDGTQGGEADMVRRMRVGQLNAALLSAVGLVQIERTASALQFMPMVYRDWKELDHVRGKIAPAAEARMLERGFVPLFWADAGWVRFFSRRPALVPDDFRRMKMFVWAGDPEQVDMMKEMGFQPVAIEVTDILPALRTGLIDAVPATPFFALAGQFAGPAPYMLDVKWVPIAGACVITRAAWDALSEPARAELKAAAQQAGAQIRDRARSEDLESIEALKRRGLNVSPLTREAEVEWRRLAEQIIYPRIRDAKVPAPLFDQTMRLLAEYRSAAPVEK